MLQLFILSCVHPSIARKAPGGVFFSLLKKFASPKQLKTIFQMEKEKKKKRLHAQKQRKKESTSSEKHEGDLCEKNGVFARLGPPPMKVADRMAELQKDGDVKTDGTETEVRVRNEEGEDGEVKDEGEVKEEEGEDGMLGEGEMMEVDSGQVDLASGQLVQEEMAFHAAQMFDRTESVDFSHLLTLD